MSLRIYTRGKRRHGTAKGSSCQGQPVGKLTRISMISQQKKIAISQLLQTRTIMHHASWRSIAHLFVSIFCPLQPRHSVPEHCPCANVPFKAALCFRERSQRKTIFNCGPETCEVRQPANCRIYDDLEYSFTQFPRNEINET